MIRPCPFCGGTDIETSPVDHWELEQEVYCNSCDASGPVVTVHDGRKDEAKAKAIELWNRRVELDALQAVATVNDGFVIIPLADWKEIVKK